MKEDISRFGDEKLRRRADQAWEMAGLARQDNDPADAARRTAEARAYEAELARRRADPLDDAIEQNGGGFTV